ncbi:tetratricopeptide repeat protein [Plesiomonas shigelloides]|uniref:tetratricopeptide repeat protein n=1 Tax=Plesiomonas shigelloides TaxID=703 RepID=UPI00387F21D4
MSDIQNLPSAEEIEAHFQRGVELFNQGNKEDGYQVVRLMADLCPDNFAYQHTAGLIAFENNNQEAAQRYLWRAAECDPNNLELYFTLAQSYFRSQQYVSCLNLLTELEQHISGSVELLTLKKEAYEQIGDKANAMRYRALLREVQQSEEIVELETTLQEYYEQAQALIESGDFSDAEFLLSMAQELKDGDAEHDFLWAYLYHRQDKNEQAKTKAELAYKKGFRKPGIYYVYGYILNDLGEYPAAREILQEGVKACPQSFVIYETLAKNYLKSGAYEQALKAYRKLNADKPSDEYRIQMVIAEFKWLESSNKNLDYPTVRQFQDKLLPLYHQYPENADLADAAAKIYQWLGMGEQGDLVYQDLIARYPTLVSPKWNRQQYLGMTHQYAEFLEAYRYGEQCGQRVTFGREINRWQGQELQDDETLLIYCEQGVGDEIRFAHNYRLVEEKAKNIIVYAEPRLIELFSLAYPRITFVPCGFNNNSRTYPDEIKYITGKVYLVAAGDLLEVCYQEYGRLLLSEPYIKIPVELEEKWKAKLQLLPKRKYNIGISWRSGLANQSRNMALFNIINMLPLWELDANIICLQYGDIKKEISKIKDKDLVVFDDLDLKNDFLQVSALMSQLDLIVTVGTAVADLGKAVTNNVLMLYPNYIDASGVKLESNFKGFGLDYISYPPLYTDKTEVIKYVVNVISQP